MGGASIGEGRTGKGPSGATLTFLVIEGAGHMVPMDNGVGASLAVRSLVKAAREKRRAATSQP